MASPGHSYDWTHWKWKQGTLLKERTVTFPFPFSIHLSLRIFGFHYRLNWTGFVILLYQLGKKLHRLRAEKLILRTMSLRYGKSMLVHISKSIICYICLLTSVLLAYPPGYFWHIWSLWTIACYCSLKFQNYDLFRVCSVQWESINNTMLVWSSSGKALTWFSKNYGIHEGGCGCR